METVGDCSAIETEETTLRTEIAEIEKLTRLAIYENAHNAVDQEAWNERNAGYFDRYVTGRTFTLKALT
jgi:hypothetical protein